jgi:transcriptional regulator with XRE-family HTH domain
MTKRAAVDPEIASMLAQIRSESAMTLAEVGARAGIADATMSLLENGKRPTRNVGVSTAYALAQALGVAPQQFMLALATGNPDALHRKPEASSTQAEVLEVLVPQWASDGADGEPGRWDPFAVSTSRLGAIPAGVWRQHRGGRRIRWPAPPSLSREAADVLGRPSRGFVAYVVPAEDVDRFSDSGLDVLCLLDDRGELQIASFAEYQLRFSRAVDVEFHARSREDGHRYGPEAFLDLRPRLIGKLRWWASR